MLNELDFFVVHAQGEPSRLSLKLLCKNTLVYYKTPYEHQLKIIGKYNITFADQPKRLFHIGYF